MSDKLNLTEIKARAKAAYTGGCTALSYPAWVEMAKTVLGKDVPALVEEVERLTAQLAEAKAALEEIACDPLGTMGQVGTPSNEAGRVALNAYYVHVNIARRALDGEGGEK